MLKAICDKRIEKNCAFFKLVLIFLICQFLVTPALPLDFLIHQNSSPTLTAIMVSGEILPNDTEFLEQFISAQPTKKNIAVYLESGGGSLYEGIKMGMYFRASRIKTVVEGGADCASACALAFLGGTDNDGTPWRSTSSNSRLGFHAFSSSLEINSDEVQRVVADILKYAVSVDAPIYVILRSLETPSDEIYWLSHLEACEIGVKVWDNELGRFAC